MLTREEIGGKDYTVLFIFKHNYYYNRVKVLLKFCNIFSSIIIKLLIIKILNFKF
jgi:hypothetical protein